MATSPPSHDSQPKGAAKDTNLTLAVTAPPPATMGVTMVGSASVATAAFATGVGGVINPGG